MVEENRVPEPAQVPSEPTEVPSEPVTPEEVPAPPNEAQPPPNEAQPSVGLSVKKQLLAAVQDGSLTVEALRGKVSAIANSME